MPEIIASGTTAVSSAEFTLTDGSSAVLSLGNPGSASVAAVRLKATDGTFVTVGNLTSAVPAQILSAAGTFIVTRAATTVAFSVDKT